MSADRLLGTLLRHLQTYTDQQDTPRILATAVSLLNSLNNPLNVTLLTSQLLSAPALWTRPQGLSTSLSLISVFHSTAIKCHEHQVAERENQGAPTHVRPHLESQIPLAEWVTAILKGADEHSSRANHLLVFCGLIIGFASRDDEFMSTSLGLTLQDAFVKAANLAMAETPESDGFAQGTICLAVNHAFVYLSDLERSRIDYDHLLPMLMSSTLHSQDGLRSGYFLGAADAELHQVSHQQFNWSATSTSYHHIDAMLKSPLVSSLGPLSRLIAHTLENVKDSWLVLSAIEDIADFSRRLGIQWRQNKLSEIDASEEAVFLHEEARKVTVPTLWKLLRSTLFAVVIVLRSAVGRAVGDASLASNNNAPHIAQETLHSLRSLAFIFTRLGNVSFTQHTFTYLTAIDILTAYPTQSSTFLQSISPSSPGQIPSHPLERDLDLFFLNTAEHFTLILSPTQNSDLLLAAASPYLITAGNHNLLPIFEAAHSITLSVFSAPQNVDITATHLPFYVDALFRVFPQNLSPRQFRLAFKNLIRVVSPPSKIAIAQPLLAAMLLDLIHERALHASTLPLPPDFIASQSTPSDPVSSTQPPIPDFSEQAVLVLTLIDALPSVSLPLLEEWLPLVATVVQKIPDTAMREHCKKVFWDVMVGGDMDAERSQVCVTWWTSLGGRDMLLGVRGLQDEVVMSGGLKHDVAMAKL